MEKSAILVNSITPSSDMSVASGLRMQPDGKEFGRSTFMIAFNQRCNSANKHKLITCKLIDKMFQKIKKKYIDNENVHIKN